MDNTSGQGSTAVLPEEIRGWNWGAFLLNWIWSIGNKSYVVFSLISIIPYIGIIMWIVLGIKGNEWAWQNRQWKNVEQFKDIQRTWAYCGVGFAVIFYGLPFIAGILIVGW